MTGDLRLVTSRSPKNVLQREAERETHQNIAAATADSPLAIGTLAERYDVSTHSISRSPTVAARRIAPATALLRASPTVGQLRAPAANRQIRVIIS